jgi:hypothetical protein
MDEDYKRTLERAVRYLCNGADAVCDDMKLNRGVPRFNYMTGGYTWDDDYVWDSWANFQWVGFLTGRLWLLHLLTRDQRYADAAMQMCERIGPVLARHATVFSSTGIDMYYALVLGYQICECESLKNGRSRAAIISRISTTGRRMRFFRLSVRTVLSSIRGSISPRCCGPRNGSPSGPLWRTATSIPSLRSA